MAGAGLGRRHGDERARAEVPVLARSRARLRGPGAHATASFFNIIDF